MRYYRTIKGRIWHVRNEGKPFVALCGMSMIDRPHILDVPAGEPAPRALCKTCQELNGADDPT